MRYQKLITVEVMARAEADRESKRRSKQIAELGIQARSAGVRMAKLATFVKRLHGDDLVPVTRQAIDLMLAEYSGRERGAPPARKKRPVQVPVPATDNDHEEGGVRLDAFG